MALPFVPRRLSPYLIPVAIPCSFLRSITVSKNEPKIVGSGPMAPYSLRPNQSEDESYHDGWLTQISSNFMPKLQDDHEGVFLGHKKTDFMDDYDG
jgi:hypothetical protein